MRSKSQSVARLPTVVSWAGWRWVKPSVGSSFHCMREPAECVDHRGERLAQLVEALLHQDEIGVVGDVAGCGAEVNDVARAGRDVPEGVDVGHHVVAEALFVGRGAVQVDVVEVGAELGQLFRLEAGRLAVVGEKTEFRLGLGEPEPEPPPGAELAERPPALAHGARCIARD